MKSTLNKVVNLYKPSGPTSFALVRRVQNCVSATKAGHIGTLDPLAEGVLPVCLNGATRIIQFMSRLPKTYLAEMELGKSTDTQDCDGQVLETGDWQHITEQQVREVMKDLEGDTQQVPPMFSAKKKNGVPLYKLARNGITVKREPVSIRLHSVEFLSMEGNRVTFRAHCSAGTYIRTLCHDMGVKLGCGAHMTRLVREKVGPFDQNSSITLENLDESRADGTLTDKLVEPDQALQFIPEIRVKPEGELAVTHGRPILKSFLDAVPEKINPGNYYRVTRFAGGLMAIAEPLVDSKQFDLLGPDEVAFKLKRVFIEP
ncbi:MAG: tRNA pseudouridine(55) synthase TruB [Candidatus Nitronauta litoralis]|uniref:tRNA pseudouridine synthase B n=1 Tax=Candidatus Nitronauta litoralis TaxID=2705533 RepID=A0A7T0BXD3_9BACT|nr:MAG: tRNA pseudouridine(55) synthase TruB [Candidatus Nitronauta litoralis]